MSNINVVRKNLGPVTAYKYAVSKGFQGTEEEFAELMASYVSIAQDVSAESRVAEGYALGKQNGVDVGDQSPYYHANAKYHAEQAAAKAQEAAESAAQAESAITVDPTLTNPGQAADAAATGALKSVIKTDYTNFTNNYFWSVGTKKVDPNAAYSTTYANMLISCQDFDAFIITGIGGSVQAKLWAFTDEDRNIISAANSEESETGLENGLLVAPVGATRLYINVVKAQPHAVAKYVDSFKNLIAAHESLIFNEIEDVLKTLGIKSITKIDFERIAGSGYKENGTTGGATSDLKRSKTQVDISNYDAIIYSQFCSGSSTIFCSVFFDDNDAVVDFVKIENKPSAGTVDYYYKIPESVVSAGITTYGTDVYCYGITFDEESPIGLIRPKDEIVEVIDKQINEYNDSRHHIRFLVLGNSYSCDSFGYVPFILKNLGVTCEAWLYKRDGLSLDDLYRRWETSTSSDTESDDYHSGTYDRQIFSVDTRTQTSWRNKPIVSAKACVEMGDWDFISLQQLGRESIIPEAYEPVLTNIIDLIRQSTSKPTNLMWNQVIAGPQSARWQESGLWYDGAQSANVLKTAIWEKHAFEIIAPYGTAVYNATSNPTYAEIGDFGHFISSDGIHLQEGLPKYVAAIAVTEAILKKFFPHLTVMFDQTVPTTELINVWNVPQKHMPVTNITEETRFYAQKCAIMANRFMFNITDMSNA